MQTKDHLLRLSRKSPECIWMNLAVGAVRRNQWSLVMTKSVYQGRRAIITQLVWPNWHHPVPRASISSKAVFSQHEFTFSITSSCQKFVNSKSTSLVIHLRLPLPYSHGWWHLFWLLAAKYSFVQVSWLWRHLFLVTPFFHCWDQQVFSPTHRIITWDYFMEIMLHLSVVITRTARKQLATFFSW